MKKRLLFLLLLFFIFSLSYAQQVPVTFYTKYECCDSLISEGWWLQSDYGHEPKRNEDGYFALYMGIKYFASFFLSRDDLIWETNFQYEVTEDSPREVVIEIPQIAKFLSLTAGYNSIYSVYLDCSGLCEGYCVDYYKNGNKRLEGNFSNGRPLGKLIFYDESGNISYIEKYSKKRSL